MAQKFLHFYNVKKPKIPPLPDNGSNHVFKEVKRDMYNNHRFILAPEIVKSKQRLQFLCLESDVSIDLYQTPSRIDHSVSDEYLVLRAGSRGMVKSEEQERAKYAWFKAYFANPAPLMASRYSNALAEMALYVATSEEDLKSILWLAVDFFAIPSTLRKLLIDVERSGRNDIFNGRSKLLLRIKNLLDKSERIHPMESFTLRLQPIHFNQKFFELTLSSPLVPSSSVSFLGADFKYEWCKEKLRIRQNKEGRVFM